MMFLYFLAADHSDCADLIRKIRMIRGQLKYFVTS